MTKFIIAIMAAGLILGGSGNPARLPNQMTAATDNHLVVIAVDGLRDDVFEDYVFEGKGSPPANSFFRELSKPNGDYKNHLRGKFTSAVFPSYTFPAWSSVFTGNYPGASGIQGQHYYMRDQGLAKNYEETPDLGDFYLCDVPDSIRIYGWDFNCGELHSLLATLVIATLVPSPSIFAIPQLVAAGGSWAELISKLPKPCVTVWVPTPLIFPVPVNFCLVNQYASGGVQNGDLLARTLYDYAREEDLNYYVVHNMYNRSNLNQSGQRIPWTSVYDGSLMNMDSYWGRPTYQEIRNAYVLPDPDNVEVMDMGVIPKAKDYVKKNGLPHILTLYFAAIDGESHQFKKFNHSSLENTQLATLRRIDLKLMDFVSFLKTRPDEYSKTIFLLISDHGHVARIVHSSSLALPADKYRVEENGYMTHVYIKNSQTGSWDDPPTQRDFTELLNKDLPNSQYISLKDDIELVLGRPPNTGKYQAYQWDKDRNSWDILSLDDLEDSYSYIQPTARIEGVNDIDRSGDIILLPKSGVDLNARVSAVETATHGSLRGEDSLVPFYIWGEPITKAKDFSKVNGPWVLCSASQVDVTPTIMNIFGIYESNKGDFDGKPLLNMDLKINTTDFSRCWGSGASDFLLGRWKNFEGEVTQILLHNPTSVDRDVVLLYYGWRENFLACQISRLSPHDLAVLDPPVEGGGPIEIRAAPLKKEKRPGGLVGYTRHESGQLTIGLIQLFLDDPDLFNIDRPNRNEVHSCACDPLQLKQSPLQKLFCPQSP